MSAWDYIMPHRLLINKSLRKASQELRDRVEAYQIEFDRRLEDCKVDLQRAEENKNKELEAFKAVLIQELSDERQVLEEIQESIVEYVDCFFYRAYLYQIIEIQKRKNDIFHEDYVFLSDQMRIIDDEIVLLRERQSELTAFTRVDDIIQLATLTGYDLDFQSADDAKQLLGKISNALETYVGEDRVEKYALLRLKTIIQERSDYLPTINYISWVIRIKRQFRKQLSDKRSDIKKEQAILRDEMSSTKKEIRSLADKLELLAKKVRYYWAKPLTYINADICYAYIELKEEKARVRDRVPSLKRERKDLIDKKRSAVSEIRDKKKKHNDACGELRDMKDSYSYDRWKKDSLKRELDDLSSDIGSLSSDIDHFSSEIESLSSDIDLLESAVKRSQATIDSKKDLRKQWELRRKRIVQFIKRYDEKFRSDRRIAEKDEINIIIARLNEIQEIRETGAAEAQRVYKQEFEEINRLHEEKVRELAARKQNLETRLQHAEAEYSKCAQKASSAEKRLGTSKNEDDRFVFVKLFSESPAVIAAKAELEKAREALTTAKKTKAAVVSMINELEDESESETKAFNEQLENCKPRYLRPTGEEQREEKKLLLRREEIQQQHEEGGHESKN